MVNHSTENSKSNQKQNQISNEEQRPVQMSSESESVSRTRSGLYGVQSELNRMNSNSGRVQIELRRMNTKMEKMLGCFYRMTHDRGKDLDQNSNGSGFREDFEHGVGHRELLLDGETVVQSQIEKWNRGIGSNFGQIESKTFDRMANQWCSAPTAMDSGDRDLVITIGDVQYPITEEVLHQIFDSFGSFEIIYLCSLENGAVQAQIRFRCSSSAEWARLSRQGRNIYDGCCHMKIEFYKQPQVVENVNRMNTKREMLIGHSHRMVHDRGQKLDCSFNGGIHELGDIRIREHGGVIENREVRSEFGYQCEGPSMEASYQPLVVKLNINGDSEAWRQHTNNKSDILKAKHLVNRSQIGDEGMRNSHSIATSDILLEKIHRDIEKPNVELSDCETNSLENDNELTILEDVLAEFEMEVGLVETVEVLVDTGEVVIDEELGNARNGMDCSAANAIIVAEIGAGCSIVASNINEEIAGDKVSKNGLLKVIVNDHFYDAIHSVLVNNKRHLMLAVGINIYKVNMRSLFDVGCEMCKVVTKFQVISAADMEVQWLRKGVG